MGIQLSSSAKRSLKAFKNQLIKHNQGYRIFTLLVWIKIWFEFRPTAIFDILFTIICGILPCFFITLYIIDRHFKKYVLAVQRRSRIKQEKQQRLKNIEIKKDREMFIRILKKLPRLISSKLLPYLTRLPVLEDCWRGSLYHYRNRHIKNLSKIIDKTCKGKTEIYMIDYSRYYTTFRLSLLKPLTAGKLKKNVSRGIENYLGEPPGGLIVRTESEKGQVLIPSELLRD